ncbi:cyclic lactone autoinducer peptide [Staphylococcus sp. SS87]|nr:cyclic lactone autoinducer peptide [Staphylococcus singaporensis]MBE5676882.1 cyclic lactone autoinducer peptide [Staphylococcus singaporensis]MCS5347926.1 cyclic lactone autoinducer peptide [Staphylococcus aureus]
MNTLINLFFDFIIKIAESIGIVGGVNACSSLFDEPKVPTELTNLYDK